MFKEKYVTCLENFISNAGIEKLKIEQILH